MNLNKLKDMDYVLTTHRSPLQAFIRARTAGWKYMFNQNIASHVGIIVKIKGYPFVAEMVPKGLKINSINKYLKKGYFKPHIVAIKRNDIYNNEEIAHKATQRIMYYRHQTVDYDFRGIIEFLWPKINDRPKKFYCSEFVQHNAILDKNPINGNFHEDDISPYGIQIAKNLVTVDT